MLETASTTVLPSTETALFENLRQLDDVTRSAFLGGDAATMSSALRVVRESLTRHFWLEEQSGYMDSVLEREPRLDRTTRILLEEHAQLLRSLNALVDEAESRKWPTEALRKQVRSWIRSFHEHENRENALVGDAFNLDIGAED